MKFRHQMALTALVTTALLAGPARAQSAAPALEDGFQNPPQSARPRVWWHWMNGNVSIPGIEKDLDWMARIGIGGLQNFDANLMTPQIVDKRLVYMTPEWKAAFRHAVETAQAKGLEFAIAASPGWSETGGPWVPPSDAMKKLVWREILLPGGTRFSGKLPAVPDVTGPYQTVAQHDPLAMSDFPAAEAPRRAQDIAVLAYPVTAPALPLPRASDGAGSPLEARLLSDSDLEHGIMLDKKVGQAPGRVMLTYARPVTVRSASAFMPRQKSPFNDPAFLPILEAETPAGWQKIAEFPIAEVPTTASFAPVTARRFRYVLAPYDKAPSPGLGDPAPGAELFFPFATDNSPKVVLSELRLSAEPQISQAEAKAGFATVLDYTAIADQQARSGIAPAKVIDLTDRLRADGTLDWTPPAGSQWRVLRFGWSLLGTTNHPATPEATGLEVDKYDAAAVRRYLETYLGHYRDTVGPDLMGAKGIRALLTDSIEVGASNWTPTMLTEFKARRGYDALAWLPALTGAIIGSTAETEKFLYDYRQTLADLLADAHYGTVAKVAHEHGLIVYGEALEDRRPLLGDDLAMRKNADVPMAALWAFARGGSPRPTLLGDMKGAASVAHVYGQNIVAAESMTAALSPWAFAPSDLKRLIDLEFAYGVNRPVIHTSVHQPADDKQPGLSLAIFGQYFNRHETWADMAKPWVDYMARTSFLLQQGRNHADIAYFHGEEAPITAQFALGVPQGLPTRYAYDFINADMLMNALSVDNGELVATGGTRYKALYLGGSSAQMRLATLQRIASFADAGIKIIGAKPVTSPTLKDDPAAFAALANRLWDSPHVIATRDVEAGMTQLGILPDFTYQSAAPDAEILFVHRALADGDAYFVTNRQNRAEKVEARFRVTGKAPELWRAIDGKAVPLSYRIEGDQTIIPLDLAPEDAVFIMFRKPATAPARTIPGTSFSTVAAISSPWHVTFQPGRGAPAAMEMPVLTPLDRSTIAGVRYFSGTATYSTRFTLPKSVKRGVPLYLNLGQVGDVADVRINGASAGIIWFAPNRVNIGGLVKKGVNQVEVRVANLWVNRLIGDKQPGAEKVTFTAAPTYRPDAPLRASGLIGPVVLEAAQ